MLAAAVDCHQVENNDRSEEVGRDPGDHGGRRVAGVIEGFVASGSLCERLGADHAERDGGNRGLKQRAGGVRQNLKSGNGEKFGNSGSRSEAPVTMTAATMTSRRLA